MKITSRKNISFPKIGFAIKRGETKEAPKDKKAQEVVLSSRFISEVKKTDSKK